MRCGRDADWNFWKLHSGFDGKSRDSQAKPWVITTIINVICLFASGIIEHLIFGKYMLAWYRDSWTPTLGVRVFQIIFLFSWIFSLKITQSFIRPHFLTPASSPLPRPLHSIGKGFLGILLWLCNEEDIAWHPRIQRRIRMSCVNTLVRHLINSNIANISAVL